MSQGKDDFSAQLRILWIIFMAMIGGCLAFAVVSLFVIQAEPSFEDGQPLLIVGGALAGAGIFGVYYFTLRAVTNPAQFHLFHIVGYALAEGATLANLVFHFATRDMIHIYIAAGVLAAMISRYPRNPKGQDGTDLRAPGSFES